MKRMNPGAWCRIVTAVVFLGFLYGSMVQTLVREKQTYSYYENRNYAAFPSFTVESLLDGSYFSALETYVQEQSALRDFFLLNNTALEMGPLNRLSVNDVVVTEDAVLPYLPYAPLDEAQIEADAQTIAQRLAEYAALCQSYGGQFYYIAIPTQDMFFADSYPEQVYQRTETLERSAQALFAQLSQRGVSYIDMRQIFQADSSPSRFFSTVDHHYTMAGAYETYRALMERIIEDTDHRPEILTDGDFEMQTLPNHYLGSRNRKIFDLWPSGERLSILLPHRQIPYARYEDGAVSQAPIYAMPATDAENVTYGMYMDGDSGHTRIQTNRPALPSILIYGESFTNAVECIAWNSFDQMDSLDLRYTEQDLGQFIAQNQPEIVVCIRDYSVLLRLTDNGK